jgi:hypothetical protein
MISREMNYRTPLGAFEFWADAADACERADLDPCTCIEYEARVIPTTCIETIGGDPNTAIRLSFQIKVF